MKVSIIESYPADNYPDSILTERLTDPAAFRGEMSVWGLTRNQHFPGNPELPRWRIIPLSWLGTDEAIRRGFGDLLHPDIVAKYNLRMVNA